jgi:hypothetical protein
MTSISSVFHYLPIYLWKNTDVNQKRDYKFRVLIDVFFNTYRIKKYFKPNETIHDFKARNNIKQKLFINKNIPRYAFNSYANASNIPIPTDFLDETKTFDELNIKPTDHIIIFDL